MTKSKVHSIFQDQKATVKNGEEIYAKCLKLGEPISTLAVHIHYKFGKVTKKEYASSGGTITAA